MGFASDINAQIVCAGSSGRLRIHTIAISSLLALALFAGGCSSSKDEKANVAGEASADGTHHASAFSQLPETVQNVVNKTFVGDLDALAKRRLIRAGVPFNRTFYFIDQGTQRGLSYEMANLFEDQLNKDLNTGNERIYVVLLPMPHDQLLPALNAGKLDIVAAQLTVTPERQKLVDFTNPTRPNINEVVVTGPGGPAIASIDDLSGKRVFVRKSSSYYASLQALNTRLKAAGKKPVEIDEAPESLEDDDLLEMVNAGLIPMIVVDNYLAEYWKQIFSKLNIHENVTLRTGGNLAIAVRKNSPLLTAELNKFVTKNGLDTVVGRVLNQRYLASTKYVIDASSAAERDKFMKMADIFKKYGSQYSFDYLMMAAQGYQESRLNQDAKSHVGAVGVMQLMPTTGAEQKVGDIHQLEPNIHAGVKYMSLLRGRYFQNEPMTEVDKALFTFAAYNAGAGRLRQLRQDAQKQGLNPNVWFGNVERVASEQIGRETVTYVSNIYKYYIAYKLLEADRARRAAAKASLTER